MDANRSVDVRGRRIVPNDFTFWLSPKDHAGFAEINDALISELAEAARAYAKEEGYHFMGPVTVQLTVDSTLKPGRFGVASQMKEAVGGAGAGSLVLPSGERIKLGERPTRVGRLADCAVVLADLNVSRRHCEVRSVGNTYTVSDLGSTNGTKVNGLSISGEQTLQDGDIITLGTTHIRFEAS
jgi:hypothetical protein